MSAREQAKGLASLGRFGDDMLVHMSSSEVRGLASLAPGGRLPTNPDTGLPEAFFFLPFLAPALTAAAAAPAALAASALPAAATAGLGAAAAAPALAAGLGTAAGAGSALASGIGAGLGAATGIPALAGSAGGALGSTLAAAAPAAGAATAGSAGALGSALAAAPTAATGSALSGAGGVGSLLGTGAADALTPGLTITAGNAATPGLTITAGEALTPGLQISGVGPSAAASNLPAAAGGLPSIAAPTHLGGVPLGNAATGSAGSALGSGPGAGGAWTEAFAAPSSTGTGAAQSTPMVGASGANTAPGSAGIFTPEGGFAPVAGAEPSGIGGLLGGGIDMNQMMQMMGMMAMMNGGGKSSGGSGEKKDVSGINYEGGEPVFPDDSYQGGIDNEWDYFPNENYIGYAEGGMVGGGGGNEDEMIIEGAIAAINGQSPNPDAALLAFVKRFGETALQDLMQRVKMSSASGGHVAGPGDGMSDSIPAMIDGQQPAAISSGEYVVPADVVSGLGNGDTNSGADQLNSMVSNVRMARGGMVNQPPKINAGAMVPKFAEGGIVNAGPYGNMAALGDLANATGGGLASLPVPQSPVTSMVRSTAGPYGFEGQAMRGTQTYTPAAIDPNAATSDMWGAIYKLYDNSDKYLSEMPKGVYREGMDPRFNTVPVSAEYGMPASSLFNEVNVGDKTYYTVKDGYTTKRPDMWDWLP